MINAISHTLVHSLWQGALLSAITGLIMTCTRKSTSALRYNLLVSAMVLFAAGVAGTFCFEFNEGGLLMPVSADQPVINSVPILSEKMISPTSPGSPIAETISSYLNRYAVVIVWVWLLIVCARCVQLATGLRKVHHLRHKDTSGMGTYWEERVRQLCGQLGIKRLVGIAQSGWAKTAMVIGHLKPLILVPLGMLTSLSAAEAEAVLLHELAHIRRSDYLVNLLQNIMEIIFFFNPAVLWLSGLIKAERENCCDDIAVARSGKVNYLKALVTCEEYKMPLTYAMTLKAGNRSLKNRAARIISNKNQSLNNREKSLLAAFLIAAGLFATAFANGGKLSKLVIALNKTATETLVSSNSRNKSEIASSGEKDTRQLVKRTSTAALAAKEVANPAGQRITTSGNIDAVQHDTTKHVQGDTSVQSDADRNRSIISDMMKDGIITTTNNLSFKIGTDEFVVNYQKQPEAVYQKYRAKYVATQYSGSGDLIWYYYFDQDKYAAMNKSSRLQTNVATTYRSRTEDDPKTDDERTKNMIGDMMKDGIITSPDNLSFKIGTDEFVVNYQKQPEAVYQKYRARYVATQYSGSDDWIWYYYFDSQKWAFLVAHKAHPAADHPQTNDTTTGVFRGKLN